MNRIRADKVIEKANKTLDELVQIYENGIAYEKYYELLEEYIKLYKRSESMIRMSDQMGREMFDDKENLSQSLEYTIKTAKNKLTYNVEEHKKSKKVIEHYKEKVFDYQEVLGEYAIENSKLQKKLQSYEKKYGEIHHEFYEETQTFHIDDFGEIKLNPSEYENKQLDEIIKNEVLNIQRVLILNLKLKDFEKIAESLKFSVPVNSLLKSVYKFIKACFGADVVVIHEKLNSFIVIADIKNSDKLNECTKKLNSKRVLFNNQISFDITSTTYAAGECINDSLKKLKEIK